MMSFWGTPAFTRFVQDKLHWVLNISHWPGLDGIVYRTAPIVDVPTMYPASYRWNFLTAPGTAMLICSVVTMAILRISSSRGLKVFRATSKEVEFALVTLAAVVGIGYLANYSGISYTLGLACASYAGKLFPIFSPAIGWLGVFLTGSVTSSAALFGKLQQVTATQTSMNPVLTTSANIFGGVAGKLISPQSIAIACAANGLVGRGNRYLSQYDQVFADPAAFGRLDRAGRGLGRSRGYSCGSRRGNEAHRVSTVVGQSGETSTPNRQLQIIIS